MLWSVVEFGAEMGEVDLCLFAGGCLKPYFEAAFGDVSHERSTPQSASA